VTTYSALPAFCSLRRVPPENPVEKPLQPRPVSGLAEHDLGFAAPEFVFEVSAPVDVDMTVVRVESHDALQYRLSQSYQDEHSNRFWLCDADSVLDKGRHLE
jgi:hypothetical protein